MWKVKVPEDVTLMHFATGKPMTRTELGPDGKPASVAEQPYSMGRWLATFVLAHPDFGAEPMARLAAHRIRKAALAAKAGDEMLLEDDQHHRIMEVLDPKEKPKKEDPAYAHNDSSVLEQFVPFEQAVRSASAEAKE